MGNEICRAFVVVVSRDKDEEEVGKKYRIEKALNVIVMAIRIQCRGKSEVERT